MDNIETKKDSDNGKIYQKTIQVLGIWIERKEKETPAGIVFSGT